MNKLKGKGIFIFLALFIIMGGIISPQFLAFNNFKNILVQSSVLAPIVFGMTMVIISGGIDLTVGATIGLSSVICAVMLQSGVSPLLTILIALVASVFVGISNGVLVANGKMQPFLVTLSTMIIVRGIDQVIINGRFIKITNESFLNISRGFTLGISNGIIFMIFLFIIFDFVMCRTILGKRFYAIGNSTRASNFSGISVARVTVVVYAISGVLAGISGILYTSRLGAGEGMAGNLYEMDAIPAVIMGGALLTGGEGSLKNSFCGLLIIIIIKNLLNLMNVNSTFHPIVTAIIIIIAVLGQNLGGKMERVKK